MNEMVKNRYKDVFSEEDNIKYLKAVDLLEISMNVFNTLSENYGHIVTDEGFDGDVDITIKDELEETVEGLNKAWYNIAGWADEEFDLQ